MEINQRICCVSDYLTAIEELNKSYKLFSPAPPGCKFIYRGHSNRAYQLLPSLYRKSHDIDITINDYVTNQKYLAYSNEEQILQSFVAEACAYIHENPLKDRRRWAEYAQHYGAPTRYLDWTENPLVALYFACKDNKPDYQQKDGGIGGKAGNVWMLHTANYDVFSNDGFKELGNITRGEAIERVFRGEEMFKYPLIYKPYYVDLRMSAQSSMFMVWGSNKEPLENVFTADRLLRSNEKDGVRIRYDSRDELAFKFEIDSSSKQHILRELDRCGINEKTLFPGLDGIGRYVEMKYRFDLEEAKDSL